METTIDKFGRIVIPKSVRESFNLMPGEHLIIEIYKEGILLKPITGETRVISEEGLLVLDGTVPDNVDTKDLIVKSRKERLTGFLP